MPEPMLVVNFPGGGHLSIEFIEDAPDDTHPRMGAWLELRADDPAEAMRSALEAGLTELKHPGHRYNVMVLAARYSQSHRSGEPGPRVAPR
jgi:hypothetical protein